GVNSGSATGIVNKLREVLQLYPAGVIDAPFLTNHDQRRVASVLGTNEGKMRNAAAVLLTMPGAPFLYYGEEVGIQNGPTGGDESKRTPMPWNMAGGFTTGRPWFDYAPGRDRANVASQTGDPSSLLSRYRALIHARNGSVALRTGTLELLPASGSQALAFIRRAEGDTAVVVHNVSDSFASVSFTLPVSSFDTLFADNGVQKPSGGSGNWSVSLPPRSSGVWRAR
ncbi:MAG TPA: alpha-amylase family glycosyl hydrolase, partial [Thermoanaerobaculia bacterium]